MSEGEKEDPRPPEPPQIKRRLELPPLQLLGVAFIIAIPILAFAGVLDYRGARTAVRNDDLSLSVEYPARDWMLDERSLTIRVRNESSRRLDSVVVRVDTAYLNAFQSSPSSASAEADAFLVPVLAPGESHLIVLTVQSSRYGRHRGSVRVDAPGARSVEARLSTFIFP